MMASATGRPQGWVVSRTREGRRGPRTGEGGLDPVSVAEDPGAMDERVGSDRLALWSDHINARMGTTLRLSGSHLCVASRAGLKILVAVLPEAERIEFTAVLHESEPSGAGRAGPWLRALRLQADPAGGCFAIEPVTRAVCWHYGWTGTLDLTGPEFHALLSAFALKADALRFAVLSGSLARH